MERTRVVLVALAMAALLGGVSPSPSGARAPVDPDVDPGAAVTRVARLIVAVPDPGEGTGTPLAVELTTGLHLADPAATAIVLPPGAATRASGPFRITTQPPAESDAATVLRVETAAGPAFSADLPATPTSDGHLTIVEVLGGPEGIRAWRIGDLVPSTVDLRLPAWRSPAAGADAVALEGAWWSLVPEAAVHAPTVTAQTLTGLRDRLTRTPVSGLRRLVHASAGDVTGDGKTDLALSFRRPFRRTLLNVSRPPHTWMDRDGLSAHVGLFRPGDLSSIWVAGTLVRPVHRLAACTGALAVAYSTLRRPAVVAATVWAWQGFGFLPLPELPGPGRPTCIDVDLDGRPDAAIVERS